MLKKSRLRRSEAQLVRSMWDNVGTNQDGPGSVGALWFRGLADCKGVDW